MTFDQWIRSKKRGVVDEWQWLLAREAWDEAIRQLCRELFALEPQIQAYRELLDLERQLNGGEQDTQIKDSPTLADFKSRLLDFALERIQILDFETGKETQTSWPLKKEQHLCSPQKLS